VRAPGGLLLRGIRWRLALSVLTVLTTTVAVAAAVLGPLYLHAAGDSVLRRVVSSAPVQSSGTTLLAYHDEAHPIASARQAEATVLKTTGIRHLFGPALETVEAGVSIPVRGDLPLRSQLFSRTSICQQLHFLSGGCHLGRGDVVMTAAGARQIHAAVGDTVTTSAAHGATLQFKLVGIVSTPDLSSPYWWGAGRDDFPIGQGAATNQGPPPTDPLIASQATVLSAGARDSPTATINLPVRHGAVGLANEGTVRAGLTTATTQLQNRGIRLATGMLALMDNADHQRSQMATIVAIAATQLVLLGMWVLGSLLVRSSDARRSEARVARLRGFPGRSMLWITAGEPGLLCLLGAALGVALAWVATVIAKNHLFAPGSVVAFDGWSWGALALVFAAIVAALGAGARRLLRATDLADGATRRPGAESRTALVTDAVLVVLAVVALVALVTMGSFNGRSNPLASAAPGILALGIAVLAVQLILFACRLGITLSAGSRAVALGLALRQTARRPGVLRQARVLVIALCLACFATAAWSVARDNRATAARFQIGARGVVTVAPVGATKLQSAVDRADPRGRWAMAVVDLHASNASMLAVDAARLPATAAWPSAISHGQSVASVARTLDAPAHPAVMLHDAPLRVTVQVSSAGATAAQLHRQVLSAWVFTPAGGTALTPLGRLRPGTTTYQGSLTGLCTGGCRLSGLGIVPAPGRQSPPSGAVTLRVTQIQSGDAHPLAADLVAGGWRSVTGGVTVTPERGSVTMTVTPAAISAAAGATGALSTPMAEPADHPKALPAVITSELARFNVGAALTTDGLDGNVVSVRRSVTASALPRLGADAAMVDLSLLSRVQVAATDPEAVDQVWLGPRAPSDALARLRAAGLRPTSVGRASTVLSALQRSGPALADDFLLVATLAALLIAAASTLGALGATTRERATELTSLEVAGVPRPALARSLALETVVLVLTASCGVGAGILAAVVAMPSLPELTRSTLAPFRYGAPAIPIALVAAVVIGLVAVAAAGVAAVLLRRMSPVLLRNAPDDVSG
jgi:putative ABC transport system permease protein